MQRCLTVAILYRYICAVSEQKFYDLFIACSRGHMQRGLASHRLRIHDSASCCQQFNDPLLAVPTCILQWGCAKKISRVNVGPSVKEQFGYIVAAVLCSHVERRHC